MVKKIIAFGVALLIILGLASRGCAENKMMYYWVIMCESKGVHDTWGDLDYPYHAYGIAQFQERTFNWMKGLADRPELEWKTKEDQLWLLKWALDNGYGKYWTCYLKIKGRR